jgi:hypothetical protein
MRMITKSRGKRPEGANVNVTLGQSPPASNPLAGKQFPCSLCGNALDIRFTHKNKPYTTCMVCGIQTFFRGKAGIKRLTEIVNSEAFLLGNGLKSESATVLYNRILQLREEKKTLEDKKGFFLHDTALENALQILDGDICHLQNELTKQAEQSKIAADPQRENKR